REGERVTYRSKPVAVSSFQNVDVPLNGSLLPHNESLQTRALTFEHSSYLWNTASYDQLEIVGCRVYTGNQDLHDSCHLYAWLAGHTDQEAIALFKAHPELTHAQNSLHLSPLMMAFAVSDPPVVAYLADHGCSWSDVTDGRLTIVHMAALRNPANLALAVQHLKSVDPRSTPGHLTPLMKAAEAGKLDNVRWLLKHGANPNATDVNTSPVAYYAISEGQPQILDALVKGGANPHYHDKNGSGWLHYAVIVDWDLLDQIHRYGVPVDDRVGKGPTPLMDCAVYSLTAVPWLISHGANPNLVDKQGENCYALAKYGNTLHTDRFFRDAVAKGMRLKKAK
ncbi:MAG TPA: ankyrin repeat domain-containing protein, partial [Fimbriimonadaceae bacterium]|nr:ankyrin repeat domain-containing protein [Fimbriimonadaceae bacterium]